MLRAKLDIFLNSEVLKKVLLALLILVCTSSCLLRSHYKRPCINSPAHWRENANEDLVIANCKWWDNLNDANLSSLIHIALENNSDLSIAVGRVNQYVAELNIAKSYQLPEISGSAAASRQKIPLNINLPPIFPTGFNIFNLFSGLLNATFYLDIWGKIQNRVDAAEAELKASIEAKRSVVLTVVSQLSVNYIQLLKYEKQQKISLDTYHSRQNSYELFKLRFEGGLISEMEVKQAEAEALEALIEVKRLIALAAQTENQISVLIGSNPVHIERGNLLENFKLPPSVPAGLPSEILEQRPDIMEAENQLKATNSRVAEAKANFFPQIDLTGSYGNQSLALNDLFTGGSTTWSYGANVFQQIFNAGRVAAEYQVATAKRMQALYNYIKTIQNAFKSVNDALIDHEIAISLTKVLEKEVEVLSTYLTLARLQYDNGQTDYLNVLDAERKLFTAQLQLTEAEAATFTSLVAIYAAVGGGWVVDADAQVARCQPAFCT